MYYSLAALWGLGQGAQTANLLSTICEFCRVDQLALLIGIHLTAGGIGNIAGAPLTGESCHCYSHVWFRSYHVINTESIILLMQLLDIPNCSLLIVLPILTTDWISLAFVNYCFLAYMQFNQQGSTCQSKLLIVVNCVGNKQIFHSRKPFMSDSKGSSHSHW